MLMADFHDHVKVSLELMLEPRSRSCREPVLRIAGNRSGLVIVRLKDVYRRSRRAMLHASMYILYLAAFRPARLG